MFIRLNQAASKPLVSVSLASKQRSCCDFFLSLFLSLSLLLLLLDPLVAVVPYPKEVRVIAEKKPATRNAKQRAGDRHEPAIEEEGPHCLHGGPQNEGVENNFKSIWEVRSFLNPFGAEVAVLKVILENNLKERRIAKNSLYAFVNQQKKCKNTFAIKTAGIPSV